MKQKPTNSNQLQRGGVRIYVTVLVAGLGIGLLVFASIRESARQYVRVNELTSNSRQYTNSRVKVSGEIVKDSAEFDEETLELTFKIKDTKNASGKTRVYYRGAKPDAFKEGGIAIVKGRYNPEKNRIKATNLMAKCPSRYKKKGSKSGTGESYKKTDRDTTDTSDQTKP